MGVIRVFAMLRRALLLLPPLAAGASAQAQGLPGEPDRGRVLAERWCLECHEVAPGNRRPWAVRVPPAPDQEPAVVRAPTFQMVADDPAATETALRAFLRTPHAAMPDLRLTPEQTDDVVAYILSLKGHRPGT
jgi:mono/diheme cytochrome c family protein